MTYAPTTLSDLLTATAVLVAAEHDQPWHAAAPRQPTR